MLFYSYPFPGVWTDTAFTHGKKNCSVLRRKKYGYHGHVAIRAVGADLDLGGLRDRSRTIVTLSRQHTTVGPTLFFSRPAVCRQLGPDLVCTAPRNREAVARRHSRGPTSVAK